MTKEGYTRIVNFHVPRIGLVVLGCSHFGEIVKMFNFIKVVCHIKFLYYRSLKHVINIKNMIMALIDFI